MRPRNRFRRPSVVVSVRQYAFTTHIFSGQKTSAGKYTRHSRVPVCSYRRRDHPQSPPSRTKIGTIRRISMQESSNCVLFLHRTGLSTSRYSRRRKLQVSRTVSRQLTSRLGTHPAIFKNNSRGVGYEHGIRMREVKTCIYSRSLIVGGRGS